jgi:NADH:ubiquinone oxidoreductase subunit 6 (subunit J)
MMAQAVAMTVFGALAVAAGMYVFRTGSMVRSAFSLLLSMVSLGAMFLAMEAEFLGVLQLMMMATEMAVMSIFMVMFMMDPGGLGSMDMSHQRRASRGSAVIAALVGVALALTSVRPGEGIAVPTPTDQLVLLGTDLMERSVMIFETAGITILVAMIAATSLAIRARR